MDKISEQNAKFWNEMCGSTLASSLGITEFNSKSLDRFDNEYFKIYPYLKGYFPINFLKNSKVGEFGLGFGSLSHFLASISEDYTGIDIAEGPVNIVNRRIQLGGLSEKARAKVGSALLMPFDSESLDFVASIGCMHHTGNFKKCIEETYRVLRPGGRATIMVYNRYSYRRWMKWPLKNLIHFLTGANPTVSASERAKYDLDTSGNTAPETQFFTIKEIKEICTKFSSVKVGKENWSARYPSIRLKTTPLVGRLLGLDLYVELVK